MGAELTTRQQIRKEKWEATHALTPAQAQAAAESHSRWEQMSFAEKWVRTWLKVIGVCIVALIILPGVNVVTLAFGALGFFAFCVSFVPWVMWSGWKLGGALGENINKAATPVPSPAYIAVQLEQEWGREPTVQEVAAVQEMLHRDHNQALVNSGIGLGALYLFERNLHG